MDGLYFQFCKVQFLCYQGEPNWLGWLILGPAIAFVAILILNLLWEGVVRDLIGIVVVLFSAVATGYINFLRVLMGWGARLVETVSGRFSGITVRIFKVTFYCAAWALTLLLLLLTSYYGLILLFKAFGIDIV